MHECGSSWCLWRVALCMWQQQVFVEGGAVHVAAASVCGGRCCARGSSWCLLREGLCMWQQLVFVERGAVHECGSSWCLWRAVLCTLILPGLDGFHALLQVVVVFLQGLLLCCLPLHTVQSVQHSTPHSTALSKHSTTHSTALSKHSTTHNMKLSTARCTIQYHTPHSS